MRLEQKNIKTVITLHKNMIFLSTLSGEGHSLRFYRELLDELLTILLHCQPAHPPPASAHRSSFVKILILEKNNLTPAGLSQF